MAGSVVLMMFTGLVFMPLLNDGALALAFWFEAAVGGVTFGNDFTRT